LTSAELVYGGVLDSVERGQASCTVSDVERSLGPRSRTISPSVESFECKDKMPKVKLPIPKPCKGSKKEVTAIEEAVAGADEEVATLGTKHVREDVTPPTIVSKRKKPLGWISDVEEEKTPGKSPPQGGSLKWRKNTGQAKAKNPGLPIECRERVQSAPMEVDELQENSEEEDSQSEELGNTKQYLQAAEEEEGSAGGSRKSRCAGVLSSAHT
jgi:hypothetical protein